MSSDIYVTFGGDTSAAEAALAVFQAQIRSANRELAANARAMNDAGAAANSAFGQKVKASVATLDAARAGAAAMKAELATVGKAAEEGFGGLEISARQGAHAVHGLLELITGETERAGRTFMGLAIHLAAEHVGFTGLAAVALALGAAFGYLAYQGYEAGKAIESVQAGAIVNQFELSHEAAAKLVDTIKELAHVSDSEAAEIAHMYEGLGELGPKMAETAAYIPMLAEGWGVKAPEAAKKLVEMFSELDTKGRAYVTTTEGVNAATISQYEKFMAAHDKAGMYSLVLSAMITRLEAAREAQVRQTAATADIIPTFGEGEGQGRLFGDAMASVGQHSRDATKDIDEQINALHAIKAAFEAAAPAADEFARALDIAVKADKPAAEVAKLTGELKAMQTQLAAATANHDTEGMTTLADGIARVSDELKKAQSQASDGLLGRGAIKQTEDSIKEWQATTHASLDQVRQYSLAAWSAMAADESKSLEERHEAHEKYIDLVIAGDNKAAKAGVKAAKETVEASQATYSKDIEEAEKTAQGKIKLYELEAKAKQITEAEKLKLTLAALSAEKTAVDKFYADELAISGLTAKAIDDLQGSLRIFNLENANAMTDAQVQAAAKTTEAWDSAAKTFSNAFTSQIDPLLKGTENWGTAGKKVLADLTEDTIKYFAEQALLETTNAAKKIVLGNTVVAANATGNAAMAASDASSAAAGLAAGAVGAIRAILTGAAEAFAGVFGFLAPVMGPAAAGPAAGAYGAVAAMAGSVASADIGMYDVPRDQLTLIHQNELVMPAAQAGAFRGMLDNGAAGAAGGVSVNPTTHFTVNALDGASVSSWMRNNSSQMLKAIDEAVSHGAHLGTRRLRFG